MSWKFVFNSSVGDRYWGHIDKIIPVVIVSGYKFFTWNGLVMTITDNGSVERTKFTVEDLK